MAQINNPEEALERAQQLQEKRLETIRVLASAQIEFTNTQNALEEAEKKLSIAYQDAENAGWKNSELRKIGFTAPPKTTRTKRNRKPRTPTPNTENTPTM